MGILFSNEESHERLASYENGLVCSAHDERVLGSYNSDSILDANGRSVAVFRDDQVYDFRQEKCILRTVQGCVIQDDRIVARYQGDPMGACAAYLLYIGKKTEKKTTEKSRVMTLSELWTQFDQKCPGFIKVISAIYSVASLFFLYQLPATVITLLESEGYGVVLLILWGGAFLIGLINYWEPWVISLSHFFRLIWRLMIPYLHAFWMAIVYTCIYAMYQGYFTGTFLSGILTVFPSAFLYLTMPLYLIQLIRALYAIHIQSK